MIYFIKNTVTHAVKIGYSRNPNKRLAHLQTATPDPLTLLGTIQGGLEHETAFHQRFRQHKLQGEWFKPDILNEVLDIIAQDAASPQQLKMNVIVAGDSRFAARSFPPADTKALVFQALDQQHSRTPIAWLITGGDRHIESFAWLWAKQNNVQIYRYFPKWRKHGRFAGFKVGPQLLRSMFDPKLLLVFLAAQPGRSTTDLIRRAEKAGIQVVKIDEPRTA
jgi:hypothetical protein